MANHEIRQIKSEWTKFSKIKTSALNTLAVKTLERKLVLKDVVFEGLTRDDLMKMTKERRSALYAIMAGSLYTSVTDSRISIMPPEVIKHADELEKLLDGMEIDPSQIAEVITQKALWNNVISANVMTYLSDPKSLRSLSEFPYFLH